MKKENGFTLIELILFIVVTGILASAILLTFVSALQKTPSVRQEFMANQIAQGCMEGFIEEKRLFGIATLTCNSTVPTFCTAPTGYNISTNVVCNLPIVNGDSNYKTITVTVSGLGNAVFTTFVAGY